MKHTFKTKLLACLLTVAMLATLVPVFFSFAEETPYEEEPEALKAENGNLAIGATIITQYTPHADSGWGWDYNLINDGSMNTVTNGDTITNGGYHPSTSAANQWNQNIFSQNHSE